MRPGICRVMIIDDHEVARCGLAALLGGADDVELVAEADSCAAAIERVAEADPDVALVDLTLPDGNGVALVAQLKALRPLLRCVMVSAHEAQVFEGWARRSGVTAYVDKATSGRALRALVGAVWRREAPYGPDTGRPDVAALSDREAEVLLLIGQGRTTKEIAAALDLSPKTIDKHKQAIREKLDLLDHDKLLRFAALACGPGGRSGPAIAADRALLAGFESRGLPPEAWTHAAHVRVAFQYLVGHRFDDALLRLRHGIQRLNATHGKPGAYHETITRAYATIIRARIEADPVHLDGDAFLAAWPELTVADPLEPLWTHYTRARLMSPEARAGWIEPDRAPLPPIRS